MPARESAFGQPLPGPRLEELPPTEPGTLPRRAKRPQCRDRLLGRLSLFRRRWPRHYPHRLRRVAVPCRRQTCSVANCNAPDQLQVIWFVGSFPAGRWRRGIPVVVPIIARAPVAFGPPVMRRLAAIRPTECRSTYFCCTEYIGWSVRLLRRNRCRWHRCRSRFDTNLGPRRQLGPVVEEVLDVPTEVKLSTAAVPVVPPVAVEPATAPSGGN